MPTYRGVVRHDYPGNGGPGYNIWHVEVASEADAFSELPAATTRLRTFYNGVSSSFSSLSAFSFNAEWVDVQSDTFFDNEGWTLAGASGQDQIMPPATAVVVGWRTLSNSRSGRGRTFLGPLDRGAASPDGTPTPAVLANLQDAADTLLAANTVEAAQFVVWSPTQQIARPFASARVSDQFAVLRSRRD